MKEKKAFWLHIPFNLLDVFLILLVILCLVGVFQRRNLRALFAGTEELETYTVSFEIKEIRTTSATLLKKDTALFIEQDGKRIPLGSVAEISGSVATVYLQNTEGATVVAAYPADTYYDIEGQLTCRGIDNNGAFLLEGKAYLAAGQTVIAQSENADFELRIVNIVKNN